MMSKHVHEDKKSKKGDISDFRGSHGHFSNVPQKYKHGISYIFLFQ